MKIRSGAWLATCAAMLMAAASVCAAPGDGQRFRHRFLRPDDGRPGPVVERNEAPPDFHGGEMFRRMTPDERRQLRRDIRNAGDDLYRRPPPRPPRAPLFEPPPR